MPSQVFDACCAAVTLPRLVFVVPCSVASVCRRLLASSRLLIIPSPLASTRHRRNLRVGGQARRGQLTGSQQPSTLASSEAKLVLSTVPTVFGVDDGVHDQLLCADLFGQRCQLAQHAGDAQVGFGAGGRFAADAADERVGVSW